jgi:hypothetical protein
MEKFNARALWGEKGFMRNLGFWRHSISKRERVWTLKGLWKKIRGFWEMVIVKGSWETATIREWEDQRNNDEVMVGMLNWRGAVVLRLTEVKWRNGGSGRIRRWPDLKKRWFVSEVKDGVSEKWKWEEKFSTLIFFYLQWQYEILSVFYLFFIFIIKPNNSAFEEVLS